MKWFFLILMILAILLEQNGLKFQFFEKTFTNTLSSILVRSH